MRSRVITVNLPCITASRALSTCDLVQTISSFREMPWVRRRGQTSRRNQNLVSSPDHSHFALPLPLRPLRAINAWETGDETNQNRASQFHRALLLLVVIISVQLTNLDPNCCSYGIVDTKPLRSHFFKINTRFN